MKNNEIPKATAPEAKTPDAKSTEGMNHAENQGRLIGHTVFFLLAVAFQLSILFLADGNHLETVFAISALIFTFFAAESFAKFRHTRRTGFLAVGIACAIAVAASVTIFFISILGAECTCADCVCLLGCGCYSP